MKPMFLNSELVAESFKRLSPRSSSGKKHLERTSALMTFLAFSRVDKKLGLPPLDFDPKTDNGINGRQEMKVQFAALVQLCPSRDNIIRHVIELGEVREGGTDPEKRITSNFLTVPLKKASETNEQAAYPKRPSPILKMGMKATGLKWGVDYHSDFKVNIPELMREFKSTTPFTDLAIFALREQEFKDGTNDIRNGISQAIQDLFGEKLSGFWIGKIKREKAFFRSNVNRFFVDRYSPPLPPMMSFPGRREQLENLSKEELIKIIIDFER